MANALTLTNTLCLSIRRQIQGKKGKVLNKKMRKQGKQWEFKWL
jgi:hypothetical protein